MKLGTAKVLSMASLLLGLAVGLLGHFLLEKKDRRPRRRAGAVSEGVD